MTSLPKKIVILADDLTGACDTVLPFCRQREKAWVVVDYSSGVASLPPINDHSVLSINLACRHMAAETIDDRVRQLFKSFADTKQDLPLLYLKLDSTVRGNWPDMVKAVYEATVQPVLVCPAYPSAGRTTRDGIHRLHGEAISQTVAGRDPQASVTTSHLPTLIMATGLAHVHLDVALLNKPVEDIQQAVGWYLASGVVCITSDAVTDSHLEKLAAVVAHHQLLPCGSAGLAHAITAMKRESTFSKAVLPKLPVDTEAMVVSGSQTPLTAEQIHQLLSENLPNVDIHQSVGQHPSVEEWQAALESYCHEKQQAVSASDESLWLFCGGETAAIGLQALGLDNLKLVGQVAVNMALLHATQWVNGRQHTYWVVLKSGNFGEASVLVDVVKRLRPLSK